MLVANPNPPAAMPEPGTIATLGFYVAGIALLIFLKRRQSKQTNPKLKA